MRMAVAVAVGIVRVDCATLAGPEHSNALALPMMIDRRAPNPFNVGLPLTVSS